MPRTFLRSALAAMLLLALTAVPAFATGFISLKGHSGSAADAPDVAIEEEKVTVAIHNQMVKTRVVQVFRNNTSRILEGEYVFPLPFGANIVSFATWDDGVKVNGIIMEKVKAKKLYEDIVAKMKDPGLLENVSTNTFKARIFPIPAYGTKRLELEYVEYLPLANGVYSYTYPLHSYEFTTNPRRLSIETSLVSDFEIASPAIFFKNLSFVREAAGFYKASFAASDYNEALDFKLSYSLDLKSGGLRALSFRDKFEGSEEIYFMTVFRPSLVEKIREKGKNAAQARAIFLVDSSYTMRGEKFEIVRKLFSGLEEIAGFSGFNAYIFDSNAVPVFDEMKPPSKRWLDVLRARLGCVRPFGDSNPVAAVSEAIRAVEKDQGDAPCVFVLISDGRFNQSPGAPPLEKTVAALISENRSCAGRVTLSTIGAGNDCENERLSAIANLTFGEFRTTSTKDDDGLSLLIGEMLKAAGGSIVRDVSFAVSQGASADIYPKSTINLNIESECFAVGRLHSSSPFELTATYKFDGAERSAKYPCDLSHSEKDWYVPLLWARERVNYLTRQIELHGDDEAMKKEIIKLSKRFNFVTRYTSFIAVPPSILRPRRIKPGDPEVTITAPADSRLVSVALPFGETVKAVYDEKKGVFVARFTAPAHIRDGEYQALILIVDRWGRERHETARFTIDSTAPVLTASVAPKSAAVGGALRITVNASSDTASISAKLADGSVVAVKYDNVSKLSVADVKVGPLHPEGSFRMEIEAIDHAGNRSLKYCDYTVAARSPQAGSGEADSNGRL